MAKVKKSFKKEAKEKFVSSDILLNTLKLKIDQVFLSYKIPQSLHCNNNKFFYLIARWTDSFFINIRSFYFANHFSNFEDQKMIEANNIEIIQSVLGLQKQPKEFAGVLYNFVIDNVLLLCYLDDNRWYLSFDINLISLRLLDKIDLN